jgi:hypothetical protein
VRINIGWCIPAGMQQSGRVPATGEETVSRESGQRTARSQSQLLQLCETWKGPDGLTAAHGEPREFYGAEKLAE